MILNIQNVLGCSSKWINHPSELEILLSYVLQKSREFIFAHPEAKVQKQAAVRFYEVCRMRAQGVPLAYLMHRREFFGLDFYVDKSVLIPRPETELLVELTLEKVKTTSDQVSICDVGTGSGCIAIALAKHLPKGQFLAVDISNDALEVARKNARAHHVASRVEFVQSDLLTEVLDRKFFGIVANLPYIGRSEHQLVSPEVAEHEPKLALYGGEKGIELFEILFMQVTALQSPPSFLIGEIGFSQREELSKRIREHFPTARLTWYQDLAGLDRAFMIEWNARR